MDNSISHAEVPLLPHPVRRPSQTIHNCSGFFGRELTAESDGASSIASSIDSAVTACFSDGAPIAIGRGRAASIESAALSQVTLPEIAGSIDSVATAYFSDGASIATGRGHAVPIESAASSQVTLPDQQEEMACYQNMARFFFTLASVIGLVMGSFLTVIFTCLDGVTFDPVNPESSVALVVLLCLVLAGGLSLNMGLVFSMYAHAEVDHGENIAVGIV